MSAPGFTKIPHWLIRDSDLDHNELVVYIVLLDHRDHLTGIATPSIAQIADEARVSTDTVRRTIRKLVARRFVTMSPRRVGNGWRSNEFVVAMPSDQPPSAQTEHGARIPKRSARPKVSENPQGTSSEPVPTSSERVPGTSSEPPLVETLLVDTGVVDSESHAVASESPEPPSSFSFAVYEQHATTDQVKYLHDLHIHRFGDIPDQERMDEWRALNAPEASRLIDRYLDAMGRGLEYTGPDEVLDKEAHDALSDVGKAWAEAQMVPTEVVVVAHLKAFERFWTAYPLKIDRPAARRAWNMAVRKANPEQIIAGARRYRDDPGREDAFTKYPTRWLMDERWNDPPLRSKRKRSRVDEGLDVAARLRAEEEAAARQQLRIGA